jgi:hypothetical protein
MKISLEQADFLFVIFNSFVTSVVKSFGKPTQLDTFQFTHMRQKIKIDYTFSSI